MNKKIVEKWNGVSRKKLSLMLSIVLLLSSCYKVGIADTRYQVNLATVPAEGTAHSSLPYAFAGDSVTLTAVAYEGYQFKEWKVITQGFSLNNISTNPASFMMPAKALLLQAVFQPIGEAIVTHRLVLPADGSLIAYADHQYTQPIEDLTKIPKATQVYIRVNYDFEQTISTIAGIDEQSLNEDKTTAIVTMNSDKIITATFNKIDYTGFTFTTDAEGAILEKYSGSRADIAIPPFYGGMPVTRIGESAFRGYTGLTSVTIPHSVTRIGDFAFAGCTGLTGTLTIPNSVTSIGDNAFYGCIGLTGTLTIPNSVTNIGAGAFNSCTGLTSVTIPNSVTNIGDLAFTGCIGLTGTLTIPNSVTSIGVGAFTGCRGLTSVIIPNSVTSIGDFAFTGCTGLTSVTIGNGVTSIGVDAFMDCRGLTSVIIPNSVMSIGDRAFLNCIGLTGTLTIPNSVTSIGGSAFEGCTGLTSVIIPNSVTSIGVGAFTGCRGLTGTLTIPNSVTSIGVNAFSDCTGLTSMTMQGTTPPILGGNAFFNAPISEIKVPSGSVGAYQAAWSQYASVIVEDLP